MSAVAAFFILGCSPSVVFLFSVIVIGKYKITRLIRLVWGWLLVSMDDPGSLGHPSDKVWLTIKKVLVASREGRQG